MNKNTQNQIANLIAPGQLKYFPSTTSTNDIARDWAQGNAQHFSLVAADEQTAGRGRGQRQWFTPPNSALAFSIILTDQLSQSIPYYTGLGAVAICNVLENHFELTPKIKWPNDILIESKKVSGILVESSWIGQKPKAVIIGIGINISPQSIPPAHDLNFPATALESHTQNTLDRFALLEQILKEIKTNLKTTSLLELIQHWNHRLAFKGETISFENAAREYREGILLGIDEQGKLMVQTEDSRIEHLAANEIHVMHI